MKRNKSVKIILVCICLVVLPFAAYSGILESGVAKLMSTLVPIDASKQAGTLVAKIYNTPNCAVYRDAILKAGKGQAATGTTQLAIQRNWEGAIKAQCVKP